MPIDKPLKFKRIEWFQF